MATISVSDDNDHVSPAQKQPDNYVVVSEEENTFDGANDAKAPSTTEQENNVSNSSFVSLDNKMISSSKQSKNSSAIHPAISPSLTLEEAKQIMLSQYIPWVNSTYGDTAKTKTITKKKYSRIVALLRFNAEHKDTKSNVGGAINSTNESNTTTSLLAGGGNGGSELAKFRLWVKSKGFHLGPPEGHPDFGTPETENTLYLPTGTDKVRIFVLF